MWRQMSANFHSFEPENRLQIFIQNPEVVRNKSPLCYHLYAHLSAWVGVSGYKQRQCTSVALHEFMLPSSRYQNFYRDLLNLFNGVRTDQTQPITKKSTSFEINLYGFIIICRQLNPIEQRAVSPKKGMFLTFKRDPSDFYIGDKSSHHALKDASQDTVKPSEAKLKALKGELGKDPDDIDIQTVKTLKSDDNIV
jgi:hypothetical protein